MIDVDFEGGEPIGEFAIFGCDLARGFVEDFASGGGLGEIAEGDFAGGASASAGEYIYVSADFADAELDVGRCGDLDGKF